VEETDPARILPERKQVAEATASGSGGALPMVPPMGMPMSPHAPMAGQTPERQLSGDEQVYTADMPAEGFGSPAVALTEGRLLPAEPLTAAPAMTARVAEPLAPMVPARPAEDDVHILPVEDTPCTCCGTNHDGQETRPFEPDEPEKRQLVDDSHQYDHHRGEDVSDRLAGTHDGNAGTPSGEVTKPVVTDDKPDDRCCACCGDEHPGLDNVTGDHKPDGATDSDEDDSDEDSGDDADGKSDGKSDEDDDCPADDNDSDDKPGDGKPGDDADDSDDRPGGDEPGDKPGDKPGQHDADDNDHQPGDKPGHHDDCDDTDGKNGKPGEHESSDRPNTGERPHTSERPPNHDGSANAPGSPGKPVTPGQDQSRTPTDSNVAYDYAKKPAPGERETMAPPLSSLSKPTTPATPTERGMAVQGKPLGERIPAESSRLTPRTSATPAIPQSLATPAGQLIPATESSRLTPQTPAIPLSPTTSVTPPVTSYVPPPTNGQQSPGGEQPQTFYTSTPPPGFQGNGNGTNDPAYTSSNGLPAQQDPATPAMLTRIPANTNGNGSGNANGNGNGSNNPLFSTTGGGPGGLVPPTNGNVGPDPNIKFDEASYTQLTSVIGGVRDTLDDATHDDVTYLDAELLLQPSNQTWEPATKLVERGGNFGSSVDTESKSLEKTLKTFHESLQLAKEVFKETDDLAAYDASKFTMNYPGFNNGGLPGGAV
jgi:hypothetical protein